MQTIIEKSTARSNTYWLLSQLYLRGPVVELYPYIESIPDLAGGLRTAIKGDLDALARYQDELAADHYHIFGLNIHPYESSFLDPENVLDGLVTERVLADYWAAGFSPDTNRFSADHIGLELKFLGDLCKTQAEAQEDRRVDIAGRMVSLQVAFLGDHLLRWLPGLVRAVCQQNAPFYTALVELTLELVIDHYQDLAGQIIHHKGHTLHDFQLPEPPDIMADESTGLRQIARYLLTPVYSGIYISREVIEGLAKEQNLPRGFGDRETMFTNLLRNAADYDLLPALLEDFQRIYERWMAFYAQLPQRYEFADLSHFTKPWQARLNDGQKILSLIYSSISENQDD